MLDDDERRRLSLQHPLHGIAHLYDPGGIEIRRRFIEQHQTRPHRQHPGERQPLLLPTGQGLGRVPERHVEADGIQGRLHPRPDLRSRHSEVLAAERHVIAHSREDHLGVGVLQHEPCTSAGGHGRSAVDDQRALALALFLTPEHAGEAVQKGRLARTRCTEHEHTLTGLDAEGDVAQRPGEATRVTPPPAAGLDGGGGRLIGRHQTRTRASRPEPNRSRAPVAAMPRASTQDRAPAMTAPEMTVLIR